ncbi:MAG: hypothetical protein LBN07_01400 [Christensenellaceae bacterium]|jgi:uncharacterized protein YrrD|nr:hypothetical protein [Christensenellaceae bacterium]
MNASELLSKTVIDINSAQLLGTAKALCFDETLKRLETIITFSDDTETDISVNPKHIYSVGSSAIMVKDSSPLMFENFMLGKNNPLGSVAYNLEGELLGKINEVELTPKYSTKKVFVCGAPYDISQILSINNNTVLINTSGKKLVRKSNLLKRASKAENIKASIMPIEAPPKIEVPKNYNKPYIVDASPTPERVIVGQSFLVGRKATKTIYGINNEILVKKEGNITQKIIETAILHSKLNELAVFSANKN